MQEAFILLKANTMQEFELAIKAIEGQRGHVLHSYPPSVIIASLQPGTAGNLLDRAFIETVDMTEISDERLEKATDEIRMAILTWNEHLRSKKGNTSGGDTSKGLSWDAPGRLPPDPPPHIQERLRRREREMQRPKKPAKNKSGKDE